MLGIVNNYLRHLTLNCLEGSFLHVNTEPASILAGGTLARQKGDPVDTWFGWLDSWR